MRGASAGLCASAGAAGKPVGARAPTLPPARSPARGQMARRAEKHGRALGPPPALLPAIRGGEVYIAYMGGIGEVEVPARKSPQFPGARSWR